MSRHQKQQPVAERDTEHTNTRYDLSGQVCDKGYEVEVSTSGKLIEIKAE